MIWEDLGDGTHVADGREWTYLTETRGDTILLARWRPWGSGTYIGPHAFERQVARDALRTQARYPASEHAGTTVDGQLVTARLAAQHAAELFEAGQDVPGRRHWRHTPPQPEPRVSGGDACVPGYRGSGIAGRDFYGAAGNMNVIQHAAGPDDTDG